eukprot:755991-Hanusia_phi.AAC.5
MSVVCFASSKSNLNIFNVGDAMTSRGWSLSILQFPASIHLCVTFVHTKPKVADKFLEDLQASVVEVETVRKHDPPPPLSLSCVTISSSSNRALLVDPPRLVALFLLFPLPESDLPPGGAREVQGRDGCDLWDGR